MNLQEPYVVVHEDVFRTLSVLVRELRHVLKKHANDNKQLDDFEYNWFVRKLDDLEWAAKARNAEQLPEDRQGWKEQLGFEK